MGLCRSGLQLPWAMRARLAELLLQCMFQDADASTRIDECEELVKVCCLPCNATEDSCDRGQQHPTIQLYDFASLSACRLASIIQTA